MTTPHAKAHIAASQSAVPEAVEAPFQTAGEAWLWAVEVLRRRRLPKLSGIWADDAPAPLGWHTAQRVQAAQVAALHQEAELVAAQWLAPRHMRLPQDGAGRFALAMKITAAAALLEDDQRRLIDLWGWGDWADPARLRSALAIQEKQRRMGVRVRISYRYTAQQLALLLGVSRSSAWRQLNAALAQLERHLRALGVLDARCASNHVKDRANATNLPRPVRRHEFGK